MVTFRNFLLPVGLVILFTAEILRVYFIMPFPGSQESNTIGIAYFLHKNILLTRIIAFIMIATGVYPIFRQWKVWKKVLFSISIILYLAIFYLVNFKFLADKMFLQPEVKSLVNASSNTVAPEKLIIGIINNGQATAYPIEIIGYHHQVVDTVGGLPVMVTYCTVCRTGRVFRPVVNGQPDQFRLVGMDHFNAMFEDSRTRTWWRQSTGEAIAGPLKGSRLVEIPSTQSTLNAWLASNPASLILQPDPAFASKYKHLEGFDGGTIASGLEKRDSSSWKNKSWVVGIRHEGKTKAYDWNELLQKRVIHDTLHDLDVNDPPVDIVVVMGKDNSTFRAWQRDLNGIALTFLPDEEGMKDTNTNSIWNLEGKCIAGELAGKTLKPVQAYQEFWHSWKTFNPTTTIYK